MTSSTILDAKVPDGPIQEKWDKARFEYNLVNPANKRKYNVIIVGSGLAGAEIQVARSNRFFFLPQQPSLKATKSRPDGTWSVDLHPPANTSQVALMARLAGYAQKHQ